MLPMRCLSAWIFILSCGSCWLPVIDSITISINTLEDTAWPFDPLSCLESNAANQTCSLRNALIYCSQSDDYIDVNCQIDLPAVKTLQWNSSHGPVEITTVPEDVKVILNGRGALIQMFGNMTSNLLSIIITDQSKVELEIINSTFSKFSNGVLVLKAVICVSERCSVHE